MLPLLHIDHLQISFRQDEGGHIAVHNSSFDLPKGSLTAIVGESGSGKSITALSILGLLSKQAVATGKILFSEDGQHSTDLISASPETMSHIRGNKIAMIFQEPMTSLNPLYTCGEQVMETIRRHKKVSKAEARAQTIQLFEQVSLPDPAAMLNRFPHQVSGGQKQRVMIAIAMSCQPALLIADEPTTALDVRVQKSILELLKKIQREQGMSVLMITHDLSLVADMADEIIVMHKGAIVEKGNALQVLQNPQHSYTKALLACRPAANSKGKRLPVISDFLAGNEHPNVSIDL
ncbi:MAG: ABC transporter ATP-binding protein, partial [Chitinophagaceae bacterium]